MKGAAEEEEQQEEEIDFSKEDFGPVIVLPEEGVVVLDLSLAGSDVGFSEALFSIGRYNEKRGIYNTPLFTSNNNNKAPRTIHLGVDLGCPAGTSVFCPAPGTVFKVGYNDAPGDYGYCLITRHVLQKGKKPIFFLYGHLSESVMQLSPEGRVVAKGDVLGHVGQRHENGGWPPHVHFQLSYRVPHTHDLPGVCTEEDREKCLKEFPDPRLVLGNIYK